MSERMAKSTASSDKGRRTFIGIRVIVTGVAIVLIAGAVLGVGSVSERNMRKALTHEFQTRLVLEARNLAHLSANALLSDFPELTLHPVVKEMQSKRSDLELIVVVDHAGIVQGHANASLLGTPFTRSEDLVPLRSRAQLEPGEEMWESPDLIAVTAPVRHKTGDVIGTVVVGSARTYVETLLAESRQRQFQLLLIILGLAGLITPLLMHLLLRPVASLRRGLERIGSGDLGYRLRLANVTELGLLADSINEMAAELHSAQANLVEKERLDHEMELARQIQQSLLPDSSVEVGSFVISGSQHAAEEVGGDYYDVFPLPDGRTGVVIADVAGKGLGGCLVTSMLAVLIRSLAPSRTSPSALMVELEKSLSGSLQPGTFVTMFYGMIDPVTTQLTFASAGHNPLLRYVAESGEIEWHNSDGIPIGLFGEEALAASLKDKTLRLSTGDVLVQYTDGITEAMTGDGEEYGFDRLAQVVRENCDAGCHAVVASLQASVAMWERGTSPSDDKTVVVIDMPGTVDRVKIRTPGDQGSGEWVTRLMRDLQAEEIEGARQFSMPAKLESLDDISFWMRSCGELAELPDREFGAVEQCLYELCANVIEHGCVQDTNLSVDIWWIPSGFGQRFRDGGFVIRDNGAPPDVPAWPVPDLDSTRVRSEGRGLGLTLILETVKDIEIHPGTSAGNVTVVSFDMTREHEGQEVT